MFRIEVIGNLGADAQIKGEGERKFISFNVAHTDRWRDDDGTTHESTQWVSCIINDVNSKVLPYLLKGKSVYVRGEGRLRAFSSEKERKWVAGVTVNVREIELIGGQVDPVPARLAMKDGTLLNIYKAFYIDPTIDKKPTELYDGAMNKFAVDKNGFVTRMQPTASDGSAVGTDNEYQGENAKTFD